MLAIYTVHSGDVVMHSIYRHREKRGKVISVALFPVLSSVQFVIVPLLEAIENWTVGRLGDEDVISEH